MPTADYVYGVLKVSIQNETWRLISVDGMKIETFADLRESAKTWKSGDVLQVTIEVIDYLNSKIYANWTVYQLFRQDPML